MEITAYLKLMHIIVVTSQRYKIKFMFFKCILNITLYFNTDNKNFHLIVKVI